MTHAHTNPDGSITLDVDPIRRIDIEDIDALDSFSRKTKRDITTLEVKFYAGGKFKISYSAAGKVIEAGGHKIGIIVSEDHVVTLRALDTEATKK